MADEQRTQLRVLTLNLHCWQEVDAEDKLHRVAASIAELQPEIVLLQEVAQHVDAPIIGTRDGETIRADNAAVLIAETLMREYEEHYDWRWFFAHVGFDVWEEGVAMLSRLPIAECEGWYVSDTHHAWNARRLLVGEVRVEPRLPITIGNGHFSWWTDPDEPFARQFDRADAILRRRMQDGLFVGDFNVRDDEPGYAYMMASGAWTDAHAAALAPLPPSGTFPGDIAGWEGADAGRIDYVLSRGPRLTPITARVLFDTPETRVSDHFGLLVDFAWNSEAHR